MGCAMQQGTTGTNIARKALLRAGLPVTTAGTTIDRQCASGLQAIALAARSVIFDGVEIAIGGGGESISLVQNNQMNTLSRRRSGAAGDEGRCLHGDAGYRRDRREAIRHLARTAGRVQPREPAPRRHPRGRAAASTTKSRRSRPTWRSPTRPPGAVSYQQVTLSTDEGPRPDTTAEGLAAVKPAKGQASPSPAAMRASSPTAQVLRSS